MGNVMGKKKRKAAAIAKAKAKANEHVVALTSSSYLQIELPREIVEDLERPRKGPGGWGANGIADPAHEMYEKLRRLDQPAIMVPKPWSEVDQILSKLKPQANAASPRTQRFASPAMKAKEKMVEEPPSPPSTIDVGELMDGLDDDARRSVSTRDVPREELNIDPMEFIKTKPFNPRKVKSLEHTLSFSTIHTVRELDAGPSKSVVKPETVENVLKRRASPGHRASDMSSPARLSNELSRRSSELTRRSTEILRRSSEIQRRSNEFQRRSSEQQRSSEFRRSNEFQRRSSDFTSTRPFSEITFAHADSVRSLVSG